MKTINKASNFDENRKKYVCVRYARAGNGGPGSGQVTGMTVDRLHSIKCADTTSAGLKCVRLYCAKEIPRLDDLPEKERTNLEAKQIVDSAQTEQIMHNQHLMGQSQEFLGQQLYYPSTCMFLRL